MAVVKLEGSDNRIRKVMKDMLGRATTIVHGGEGIIHVEVPNGELSWVDRIAKDFGVKKMESAKLPSYEKAPCGILTTRLRWHVGRCKKCAALRQRKPVDGEVKTVVRVEGLQDLSLNGLINLMKVKMDEAMALAQEYDTVIKAIEKIPELESQMRGLVDQIGSHKEALKYFMKGG